MKQLMYLSLFVNDAAAASADYYATPTHPDGGDWELVAATWTPITAATTDGTEARTLTLYNGATAIGVITTDTDGEEEAWVAGTPIPFELDGAAAALFTANEEALKVASVHAGSTGRAAKGTLTLCFERRI